MLPICYPDHQNQANFAQEDKTTWTFNIMNYNGLQYETQEDKGVRSCSHNPEAAGSNPAPATNFQSEPFDDAIEGLSH